jgi:O-antigen/teichoic acid export membrane protein
VGIIKKLASQTAIYGISSMLGRFINFLLVIPHTKNLNSIGAYGDITAIFAFMAFFNIILTYGMDTAYFNFIRKGNKPGQVYAISQKSIIATTAIFSLLVLLFVDKSSDFLGYPGNYEYVYCCLIFLVFDTLSVMPFSRLRYEEKPLRFALVKLANIGVNVTLNLIFLTNTPSFLSGYSQVTLILLANAVASITSFILLSPLAFSISSRFDKTLLKQMLEYAWPLIFVGLAGIVNETLDRTLIRRLLPSEEGSYQNGIYGAFYKLTMVMTMFVQAFRFAAVPFFFKQKESAETRQVYANVMYWFIGICSFIFLASMGFINELAHLFIKNPAYFNDPDGLFIVPILLMANLFLGVYYNLSVWYQLSNKTKIGALVAAGGAIITIALNLLFIPEYGFVACAWITLLVYSMMCISAYMLGHYYYPVPYHIIKYVLLIAIAVILWLVQSKLVANFDNGWLGILVRTSFPLLFLLIIWLLQPKRKNA